MKRSLLIFQIIFLLLCSALHAKPIDYLLPYFKEAPASIFELKGGLSGAKNYKVTFANRDYVLRILDPNHSLIDRKNEIMAAAYAGEHSIGPYIHYIDPNFDAMIMDFIQGKTLSSTLLTDKELLYTVIKNIKRLHDSNGNFPLRGTIFETIKHQLETLKQSDIPAPLEAIELALIELKKIEKVFKDDPLVPCHNDLSALNVIEERANILFIDWTDSSLGYAINDLGYFVLVNSIDKSRNTQVLEYYFGREPTNQELHKIEMMKKLNMLRIFASNFPAYESPITDASQRLERKQQIETQLWNPSPVPLDFYFDLHSKGKLQGKEIVIDLSLSALRWFLTD